MTEPIAPPITLEQADYLSFMMYHDGIYDTYMKSEFHIEKNTSKLSKSIINQVMNEFNLRSEVGEVVVKTDEE